MEFALNHITTPKLPLDAFFALARKLGMKRVEIRNDLPDIVGQVPPSEVRASAAAAGVEIAAINALYPFNDWSGDLPERALNLADYAAEAGAKALVMCPRNDGTEIPQTALVDALGQLKPILSERGLTGLLEPLGFPVSSLQSKALAVAAIEEADGNACFRLVHDTFHHHLAGETGVFADATGLVHISGVTDPALTVAEMLDDHRVLVDAADRLENVPQIRALMAAGYTGPFSFEPFAPDVQALDDPESALRASMDYFATSVG
ncbi:TIM barrel protein [Tropicimonas sp. TH_r6]|uniref:TIM barrel protein n=1 Tax=Tropicimonas sp. TH_r6 TaxID=3082085 RepID=UPI002952C6B0|nr:TIM barrel protein [Tropicimonas sp. TH_r6]MDV7143345.1 TIM barrel protein [Tropicimonas sp. TH_r6]